MTESFIHPIADIVIAFVGAGGGGAAIVSLVGHWWKSRQSRRMDDGYVDISAVYDELQQLATSVKIDRVLVIKSENGGGMPAPGSVIKSTAVFEYYTSKLGSLKSSWQQVFLDQHYSQCVSNICTGAWAWQSTSSMDEGTVLRDLCGEGVLVGMARICKTPSALWYICVNFQGCDGVSEQTKARIRTSLHKMRLLFGRHHKLLTGEAK